MSAAHRRPFRLLTLAGALILILGAASPIAVRAVVTTFYAVSGTADNTNSTPSSGTGTSVDPYVMVSLRGAVLHANINAVAATISIPAGTYPLSVNNPAAAASGTIALPDLQIGSHTLRTATLVGTGGMPKIQQTVTVPKNDVITTGFDTDLSTPVAVDLTLQNLEITGGTYTGIFTGVDNATGRAKTTIIGCNIHDNSNSDTLYGQGGAIFNETGDLTIQDSTFSNNTAVNATNGQGGAIFYDIVNTTGFGSQGVLTITNSTFTNNTAGVQATFPAGGAVFASVTSTPGNAVTITGSTFIGNKATGGGDGGAVANALAAPFTISTSTFTGNQATTVTGHGGAIDNHGGQASMTVSHSRFVGNTATTAGNGNAIYNNLGTLNAADNWWGQNTGPATNDVVNVTVSSWLQLRNTGSPSSILRGQTSSLTADLLGRNTGGPIAASNLVGLASFPVPPANIFSNAVRGSLSVASTQFVNGQATATFTAGTSSASCGIGGADGTADNQTVTATVGIQCPDLTASKANTDSGSTTLGNSWQWRTTVSNASGVLSTAANFTSGQTIFTDTMPATNMTYSLPGVGTSSGVTGTINCGLAANVLSCTAGGAVSIAVGGSFRADVTATPAVIGTYTNPTGGSCTADPNDDVVESDETNNACNSDSVVVTAPDLTASKANTVGGTTVFGASWQWQTTVANAGNGPATYTSGQTIFTDDVPATGLSYSLPTVGATSGTISGTIACAVSVNTLSCTANGGPVSIAAGASFRADVTVTTAALGTYINPPAPGACRADPNNNNLESNEANNDCTDSVVVNPANTTTTISSNLPDPSVVGQSVAVNYAVSVNSPGGGSPTGNVTVSDGTDSCTNTVGAGSCAITFSSPGSKLLTATYHGDTNFTASPASSPATPHVVNQADTATTISSDVPDPSNVGQSVAVNYGVTVNSPGGGSPSGNVTVTDGVDSCTGTVAAGTCSITLTTSGSRTLTATYAGDAEFTASTSTGEPHSVNTPVPDSTPPVTSNVTVILRSGGQVDSGPVLVSWTASDDVTPAANLLHEVQIRRRAHNFWGPWTAYASVTGSQAMVALPLWRPFEFRVRTRDEAGNWGDWAQSSALTLLRRDESYFRHGLGWTRVAVAGAMRGHVLESSTVGSWARLRFFGDGAALVMTASAGMGSVSVCLDPGTAGAQCQSVDLSTLNPGGQRRLVAVFADLPYGRHYLRVTITGGTVDLDGAIIDYPTWG